MNFDYIDIYIWVLKFTSFFFNQRLIQKYSIWYTILFESMLMWKMIFIDVAKRRELKRTNMEIP